MIAAVRSEDFSIARTQFKSPLSFCKKKFLTIVGETMRQITEEEAWRTAGASEPPVLEKYECEIAQIAITLKRWPEWWILALHREADDRLELYRIDSESDAWEQFRSRMTRFEADGTLFET